MLSLKGTKENMESMFNWQLIKHEKHGQATLKTLKKLDNEAEIKAKAKGKQNILRNKDVKRNRQRQGQRRMYCVIDFVIIMGICFFGNDWHYL